MTPLYGNVIQCGLTDEEIAQAVSRIDGFFLCITDGGPVVVAALEQQAEPASTALPPLRSLTLSTDLEPASHQVRAAFGSAELVR